MTATASPPRTPDRAPRTTAQGGKTPLWVDVPFLKAIQPAEGSGDLELSGYASTWGMDRDDECVAPNAFDSSLADYLGKNPMLLWQHNKEWPIGRVLAAKTDDTGLYVTAVVPNPGSDAADWQKGAYTAIKNGIVRTFSIGGYFTRDVKASPAGPVFVITDVELFEISCVSIPANADSVYQAAVKALSGERPDLPEKAKAQMEQLLGFKRISDPELAAMDEATRERRYTELAAMFERAHAVDPPPYDAWRRVGKAMEAGVDVRTTAAATLAVSNAFYRPEVPDLPDPSEKAGRTISAANRSKLEGVLAAHDGIEENMVQAAEAMKAAAACHADAITAVRDVLGITDENEPEADAENDQTDEDSPEKAAQPEAKQLTSDLFARLRQAGNERFAAPTTPTSEGAYCYVDDVDLDEGYVVYAVLNSDGDRYLQVPILRGADGSVSLGDGATEVEPQSGYRPKAAATGDAKAAEGEPEPTPAEPAEAPQAPAGVPAEPVSPPEPEVPDPAPEATDQKDEPEGEEAGD